MVGLAAKRLAWVFTPKQLVGQVYKFQVPGDGENSMQVCGSTSFHHVTWQNVQQDYLDVLIDFSVW